MGRIWSPEGVHFLKHRCKAFAEFESLIRRYQAQSHHQHPEIYISTLAHVNDVLIRYIRYQDLAYSALSCSVHKPSCHGEGN